MFIYSLVLYNTMDTKVLETREQGNLRFKLILNEFGNDRYNYSVVEELIKSNGLLNNNAELDRQVFDTLRKARTNFNTQTKGWFIV